LNGIELAAARSADTVALLKDCTGSLRRFVVGRMRLASGLFAIPDPEDLYLSKFGIVPSVRGQGHGAWLLKALLEKATAEGYRRLLLDVSVDNLAAIHIYERAGFETKACSSTVDGVLSYRSMACNLTRGLLV
jgi:ribosomal protein S18 acetylase RimI-like enzyme